MSRKWVLFLSAVIMLALALVVARVFREPLPPLAGNGAVQVGDSVTGPLQTAPAEPLPSPLPPPEAMLMSSGDSASLPVTTVEPQIGEPAGVAPVVRDSTSGSGLVTEPPRAPSALPPSSADKTEPASSPAPIAPGAEAPASPAPETAPPTRAVKPEDGDQPAPSVPSAAASESAPAPSPPPAVPDAKADKPLKPGTLVTKSSLPAKAGSLVVTSATLAMDGDVVTLTLQGTGAMRGKTFILAGPDRVVLDIEGDWKMEAPRVPSNRMVRSLRVGARDQATRLVFDMRVKPLKVKVAHPAADSLELTIR